MPSAPSADERLQAPVKRHEPHLVDDRDDLSRRRRGGAPDRAQPLERIGQWLLDEHVQPAFERRDDVAGVRRVGRAHDHRVEIGPEALLVGAEQGVGRARRGARGGRRLGIEDLRHAASGDAGPVERMRLARAAESDEADAERHVRRIVSSRIRESMPTDGGLGTPRASAARSTAYSACGPSRVIAYRRYLFAGPPLGSQ